MGAVGLEYWAFPLSLAIAFGGVAGLGGLVPGVFGPGLRFAVGAMLLPAVMLVGNFLLGLPLSTSAWMVGALAALGLARLALRPTDPIKWATHPVVVLPLLVIAVSLAQNQVSYLPYSWDEFSGWLRWPLEAFLHDDFVSADLWREMGYTQGLSAAGLFPQLFFADFAEIRLLAYPVMLHAAMLGVGFDVLAAAAGRLGLPETTRRTFAWVTILALLAVEASWTLVPQLNQSEKPQIYLLAIILFLLADAEANPARRRAAGAGVGLALATGFLVKSGFLAVAPPALAGLAWVTLRRRRDAPGDPLAFVLGVAPLLAAVPAWALMKGIVAGGGCMGDPLTMLSHQSDSRLTSVDQIARLVQGISAYLVDWKLPITVAAFAGVAVALTGQARIAALVLMTYAAIHLVSLHLLYSVCMTVYEGSILASLPRYLRVVLRSLHVAGLAALAVGGLWLVLRLRGSRWLMMVLVAAVVGLGAYQIRATAKVLDNITTRNGESGALVPVLRSLMLDIDEIAALSAADGTTRVQMLAQGTQGEHWNIARYYSLGRKRGGPIQRYHLKDGFSFAHKPADPWAIAATDEQMARRLAEAAIIWPVAVDPWMADQLTRTTGGATCPSEPPPTSLVRNLAGILRCKPRTP